MIRIAFVIDTIASPTAGTERQLLFLLRHLDRGRFAPVLCVLQSSPWLETRYDLSPSHVVGVRSFRRPGDWRGIVRFSEFLRREEIDVVQTFFRDSGIAGTLAARLAGRPLVVGSRRNQGYWMESRGELLLQRLLNRWVSSFVANCRSTRDWAAAAEGIAAERIRVIYNGLEPDRFGGDPVPARAEARLRLGIPEGVPVVGAVANLRPVKGLDIFLQAAGLLRAEIPEARFVLIGDGPERRRLEHLAEALGVSERTTFLGAREDVPALLPGFDAGVLASHSESFSNALIEYLAAGLPVACTDVGGCREAVEDGANGFVVPKGDPAALALGIARALRCDREEMAERNRRKAQALFSGTAGVRAHEALYAELLERVRRPVPRPAHPFTGRVE